MYNRLKDVSVFWINNSCRSGEFILPYLVFNALTRAPHSSTWYRLSGAIFKFKLKRAQLQLSELCPLSCNLSWWASIPSLMLIPSMLFKKWATLKFLNDDNDDLAITIARLFLRNRQANKNGENIKLSDSYTVKEDNISICACSSPHSRITFLNKGVSTMLGETLKYSHNVKFAISYISH